MALYYYLNNNGFDAKPLHVPQSYSLPVVTYTPLSRQHGIALPGSDGVARALFSLDVWSTDYNDLESTSEALRALLSGYAGFISTFEILGTFLEDQVSLYQEAATPTDLGTHHSASRWL